jgi:phage-related protein
MALVGQQFNEVGQAVGEAVLPALQALLPAILPVVQAFGELVKDVLPVITPLLKAAAGFLVDAVKGAEDLAPILLQVFKDVQPWLQGVHDLLKQLADAVIPPVVDAAKSLWDIFGKIVDVLAKIVGAAVAVVQAIAKIAAAIGDAMADLQHFLQSLNPLEGFRFDFQLPFLQSAGPTSYITINTGADPRAVVSAVRQWAGANGGLSMIEGPGA